MPWLVKKAFPSYVWDITTQEKVIYLTFDDGPTPVITEKVLEILAIHKAKATFFCIGKNIVENPTIYQQILDENHAVGNHTYNHLKGWLTSTKKYVENTLKTEQVMNAECRVQSQMHTQISNSKFQDSKLITNVTSSISTSLNTGSVEKQNSKLFRPPYGKLKPSQGKALQKLGYHIIMWDIIAYDWDTSISEKEVLQNVVDNTKNGSIIVLHDSVKASKNMLYTLPKVLEHFTEKGFVFEKIKLS